MKLENILDAFSLDFEAISIKQFGTGLINHTWKVTSNTQEFILQKINDQVFNKPFDIAENIEKIGIHFNIIDNAYPFTYPVPLRDGSATLYKNKEGYFRLLPFISGSHSKDVITSSDQAYEAASQFGKFTYLLRSLDAHTLKITIPDFHNITLRYTQFTNAIKTGHLERVKQSTELIKKLLQYEHIVTTYEQIKNNDAFKIRVTHHDTKISNVLFNEYDKGICVIDFDTVMPGYFISDIGDMMRTYLCPVSEEETDFEKIAVRGEVYKAIIEGYKEQMKDTLTPEENAHFFYAGQFLIYMQALRFLTDYLNNDIYYGAKYDEHNFMRAGNQIKLLEQFTTLK